MAREIKYFSGTANTNTILYTVPAGRTAKVILNRVVTGVDCGFSIAGNDVMFANSSYGSAILAGSSSNSITSPGENQGVIFVSSIPYIANVIWYIGPGAAVSAFSGSFNSVLYNFLVIEEF